MNNTEFQAARNRPGVERQSFKKRLSDAKFLLILFAPAMVFYILFEYLPMFGLVIAFKDYNAFKGVWASEWVGFKYFSYFFQNPDFLVLLKNTLLLGFYSILFGFPAPILLALLMNELRSIFFKRFVQTVSYLPHFISNVIMVSMIIMFLSPTSGMINQIVQWFGGDPIYFLSKPEYFRTIYVTSGIWQGVGWGTIIYLAALSSIDPHLYEAAEIDGAGRWKKMWHITLPGIVPVMFILLILNVGSLMSTSFEKVYLLYNPLVYSTADIFSTYTYRVGLLQGNFSYSTAIGMFNGITSFLLLYAANFAAKKIKQVSLW
ncbi:ABC transporter permease [Paenibacillus koleovorans]|uniref:ABC transporter permease n=1 Tax=Paenibacillus koleovorans TaxID=121608 RepID=UPI000FD7F035|nr:ABC transporter permease subunit [Paenibacillus koleovorans]